MPQVVELNVFTSCVDQLLCCLWKTQPSSPFVSWGLIPALATNIMFEGSRIVEVAGSADIQVSTLSLLLSSRSLRDLTPLSFTLPLL